MARGLRPSCSRTAATTAGGSGRAGRPRSPRSRGTCARRCPAPLTRRQPPRPAPRRASPGERGVHVLGVAVEHPIADRPVRHLRPPITLGLGVALTRSPVPYAVPQRFALVGQRPGAERDELVQAARLGLAGLQVGREELPHPRHVPADLAGGASRKTGPVGPVELVRRYEPRRVDAHAQAARHSTTTATPSSRRSALTPALIQNSPALTRFSTRQAIASATVNIDGTKSTGQPGSTGSSARCPRRGHDLMQALERGDLAGARVADDNRRPEDDVRHAAGPNDLFGCQLR